MRKNAILFIVLSVLAGALVWQQAQLSQLRLQLEAQKMEGANIIGPRVVCSLGSTNAVHTDISPLRERLSALGEQVRQLTLASESLMERGQIPLSVAKAAELKKSFLDSSLPDAERLRVLRILRRHRAIDDSIVSTGLAWMEILTNPRLISDVLEEFVGMKNSALREKALQLVAHPNEQLRRRAANVLSGFDDAEVETALWTALSGEQNREVRQELEEALRDLPMNSARQAKLESRVLGTGASLSERLAAFQVLISAKVANAKTVEVFANELVAQNNADQTAQLFRVLDNTGNLAAAPALIQGLQMDDPRLRGLALDALSEMQTDPTVVKWLQHAANNDVDERVRAEAVRVLDQAGNRQ